ncbi:MAG TPA: hypothetical protein VGM57_04635 [Pseudolabrys sp.]|jgi:hypothetical protein
MTPLSTNVKVLNSLLYIKDARQVDLPDIDGRGAYWFTPSCVAVSCLPDCDGPTTVAIGAASEMLASGKLIFDSQLETPSRRIVVETVLAKKILEQAVLDDATRVRIWTNGFRDTDKVTIGLG